MPLREFHRNQQYLLPPSLDDWVPDDHPIRYVAAFVEQLDERAWQVIEIDLAGEARGAPAYDPRMLVSVWLAGFMLGIRSSRKLEAACRDQVSFRWLTGNQTPDHNTLARFLHAHRQGMRQLLRCTVQTAIQAGLVDLALVAVDGTKVAGNVSRKRTLDAEQMQQLLQRTETAIADLEAQNVGTADEEVPTLPTQLRRATALRDRIRQALAIVQAADGPTQVNLSDLDARVQKARQGYVTGYNAQGAATRVAFGPEEPGGLLLLAAEMTAERDDHRQLLPVLEAVTATAGAAPAVVVADGGYHSGAVVAACAARNQVVVMPETQSAAQTTKSYHKQHFTYDPEHDTYTCPTGHVLTFRSVQYPANRPCVRIYRGQAAVCRACPAFGVCTTNRRQGRSLAVTPDNADLNRHRAWMATAAARALADQRKMVIEPVFGILKEQQHLRRFLLRGIDNVAAEWSLLAVGFNLRTLARAWVSGLLPSGNGPDTGSTCRATGWGLATTAMVATLHHITAHVQRWKTPYSAALIKY